MPTQRDFMKSMPKQKIGQTKQELIDEMSIYIVSILRNAYEEATPLIQVKPPPPRGFLSKNTIRQMAHSKKLYRALVRTTDDEKKPKIREKLLLLNRVNRHLIRKDRENWEMRTLHLSVEKEHDFYRFMNGITRKTKTLGPIHSSDSTLLTSDKEMSEAFNTYLCGLMLPSTIHNINWDVHHEPKKSQLYVAAIPGSTALKPMESDVARQHIIELHRYLKPYGYDFTVGNVIDSYPLGEQPRGETQIPVVLTYKDEATAN